MWGYEVSTNDEEFRVYVGGRNFNKRLGSFDRATPTPACADTPRQDMGTPYDENYVPHDKGPPVTKI